MYDVTQLVKGWKKDIMKRESMKLSIMEFYPKATVHICITKAYSWYFFDMIVGFFQQVEPKFC